MSGEPGPPSKLGEPSTSHHLRLLNPNSPRTYRHETTPSRLDSPTYVGAPSSDQDDRSVSPYCYQGEPDVNQPPAQREAPVRRLFEAGTQTMPEHTEENYCPHLDAGHSEGYLAIFLNCSHRNKIRNHCNQGSDLNSSVPTGPDTGAQVLRLRAPQTMQIPSVEQVSIGNKTPAFDHAFKNLTNLALWKSSESGVMKLPERNLGETETLPLSILMAEICQLSRPGSAWVWDSFVQADREYLDAAWAVAVQQADKPNRG